MTGKEFLKIETKANTDGNGNLNSWQELSDQAPEYWTERAMKKLPLEELYPQKEGEEDEDYKKRISAIDALTSDEYDEKNPYKIEKQYPDGYPYGRRVYEDEKPSNGKHYTYDETGNPEYGYKFVEHINRGPAEELLKNVNESVKKCLEDGAKARETGELAYSVSSPKNYGSRQEMARHYIGPLSYDERVDQPGLFQHVGEEYYSEEDAEDVKRIRQENARKDQGSEELKALRITGKMLEGFFCPLVNQGFFDSLDGQPAAFIATSECDDYKNQADAAVSIPIVVKGQGDEKISINVPIVFDLTTGTGDGKVGRIREKYSKDHGFTDLKYPATCLGDPLPAMDSIPHFVLCLPRQRELMEFDTDLAGSKAPSRDIQSLINFQLYVQSRHWMNYWDKRKENDQVASGKADLFAGIATYFGQKLAKSYGSTNIEGIVKNHSRATHYLFETGIL